MMAEIKAEVDKEVRERERLSCAKIGKRKYEAKIRQELKSMVRKEWMKKLNPEDWLSLV